jgi:Fe-S cluster assembly iron-binding protein IscA
LIDQDPIHELFIALAGETDCWVEMEQQFAPLAAMDEDAAEAMLEEHSGSIFVNAASINIVNEGSLTYLEDLVQQFDALTNGALALSNVRQVVMKNGFINVSFRVEGLGNCQCEVEDRKRPDVTPAFSEMNRIAQHRNLGRFLIAPEGNSEQETFIFTTDAHLVAVTKLLRTSP